jgi:ABC-type Fe3+-hydroxamate transport system substrate-binding protein
MATSTDQLNNVINLPAYPRRIVSLVPSQTEFLFELGLDEEIVGLTRFCVHPKKKVKAKEKIGGTKRFDIERIKALKPDLIIGNKEENYEAGIVELQKHFPVWMSDIYNLDDACQMMHEVSALVDRAEQGQKIIAKIKEEFALYAMDTEVHKPSVAYFIWRKPYMVAASNTFIDYMLGLFDARNVYANEQRYPKIQPQLLEELKPDFIFLSSEPYSFSEKHFEEFREFCPTAKVTLVDGEMFSWYGSRLLHVPGYFRELKVVLSELTW